MIVVCNPSDVIVITFGRVLTPYYKEDVTFSIDHLEEPNEDGVSILFYLQKIFPGSFSFLFFFNHFLAISRQLAN